MVERYAGEVWQGTDPNLREKRGIPVGELLDGMEACIASKRWARRGPLTGAIRSLGFLGWKFLGATTIVNDKGETLDLLQGSPVKVRHLMEDRLLQQHEEATTTSILSRNWAAEEKRRDRSRTLAWTSKGCAGHAIASILKEEANVCSHSS